MDTDLFIYIYLTSKSGFSLGVNCNFSVLSSVISCIFPGWWILSDALYILQNSQAVFQFSAQIWCQSYNFCLSYQCELVTHFQANEYCFFYFSYMGFTHCLSHHASSSSSCHRQIITVSFLLLLPTLCLWSHSVSSPLLSWVVLAG